MDTKSAAMDDQNRGPTIVASILLVYTALITKAVSMGVIGRHVFAIEDQESIPPALKLVYISYVLIIIGCVLSKTSFAFTLLRIVTRPWMKVLIWFIIVSMNAIMWLCAISYLAQCRPAAALWNVKLMATAKCWPTNVFETIALVAGSYSGCMDFILSVLPWIVLWELEMKKREKAGIALAMSMGIFAAVTAFIKTSKLVNVAQVQDFTWFCSSLTIWAAAETGLTIFAASIPALRLLVIRARSNYDDYPTQQSSRQSRSDRSHNRDGAQEMQLVAFETNHPNSSVKSFISKNGVNTTEVTPDA
ncbi:hypothetical protein N7470_005368 [Penicillium chermesinum]|nr:hypothetical protein N7470_005368 [Penicillium chermesinum]